MIEARASIFLPVSAATDDVLSVTKKEVSNVIGFSRVPAGALVLALGLAGCTGYSTSSSKGTGWIDMCNSEGYPSIVLGVDAESCQDNLCVSGPACIDFDEGKYLLGEGARMFCEPELRAKLPEGPAKVAGFLPSACVSQ